MAPWPCTTSGDEARNRGCHGLCRGDIAKTETAAHRNAACAKRQMGREFGKHAVGVLAAGQGVRDNADLMAVRRLTADKVDDVTE